jgi:hypothetical protein
VGLSETPRCYGACWLAFSLKESVCLKGGQLLPGVQSLQLVVTAACCADELRSNARPVCASGLCLCLCCLLLC